MEPSILQWVYWPDQSCPPGLFSWPAGWTQVLFLPVIDTSKRKLYRSLTLKVLVWLLSCK